MLYKNQYIRPVWLCLLVNNDKKIYNRAMSPEKAAELLMAML
jgi:hypothetical protein